MTGLDLAVFGAFLAIALGWGAWHARRAGRSIEAFFAADRSLPWWLAGTSIVATTFAADTPLAIAGLVATGGVAGNWFWWADVLPVVMGAFLVSHLWKRSGVLTDNEIIELRYGGRPAAGLRLFRALYFGVLRNAIVMGWVNLAMVKILSLVLGLDDTESLWLLFALFLVTVAYTLLAGLIGVVFTDFLQFGLALAGSILLAILAVGDRGGLGALVDALGERRDLLAVVPSVADREAFWAFLAFVAVKSWSSGNTEGNGYTAQRILATRSERDARLASLWYAIAHFALRPWPWIVVGLVAVVQYPDLSDPEEGYVRVMLDTLPPGLLGLLLAAMFAAFMSTIDTQLNWGASYLTHDVYARFLDPHADDARLVRVARASVVGLAGTGALATLGMDSVAEAWKLLATISAGTGLILLLRWLWWRINAWSEIAVMTASLVFANAIEVATEIAFPFSLVLVVALSLPVAFAVTFATPPEDDAVLARFYRRVRPAGAWDPVAAKLGLPAKRLGWGPWFDVLAATAGIYAAIVAAGALLVGASGRAIVALLATTALLAFAVRRAEAAPGVEPPATGGPRGD
ncbi:MAG: sodium:solute symporter family protein [Myxococcota bacterium]